jgi:replicative DNA helicase
MEQDKPNTRARKKPLTTQQVGDIHGKIPPQDVELEKVVLGALLLDKNAFTDVADILKPDVFYHSQHVKIFEAMLRLFNSSRPIDIITVTEELRKSGDLEYSGGPVYIASLTNRVGGAGNIDEHIHILLEKHVGRMLIQISDSTMRDAYDCTTDVFELLDGAETKIIQLHQSITAGKEADSMDTIMGDTIRQIEKAVQQKGITGVQSGLQELDRATGGWQPTDLIILAARPGMGKTALVLKLATGAAGEFKKPTALFSLEMNKTQLGTRALAIETGIENKVLARGLGDPDELFTKIAAATARLNGIPLYIDDTPGLSIPQFRSKAKKLVAKHGVKMIIIDYLQLMTVGGNTRMGNREAEISFISRQLKIIAKELNIPIIALSQLSRSVETRGGAKRPQLSDLRESGAIEQDADMVCFIYRPAYYGFTDNGEGYTYPDGYTEIIIEKHRNGSCGIPKIKFDEKTTAFTDLVAEMPSYGAKQEHDKNSSLKANTGFEASPTPTDDLPF